MKIDEKSLAHFNQLKSLVMDFNNVYGLNCSILIGYKNKVNFKSSKDIHIFINKTDLINFSLEENSWSLNNNLNFILLHQKESKLVQKIGVLFFILLGILFSFVFDTLTLSNQIICFFSLLSFFSILKYWFSRYLIYKADNLSTNDKNIREALSFLYSKNLEDQNIFLWYNFITNRILTFISPFPSYLDRAEKLRKLYNLN